MQVYAPRDPLREFFVGDLSLRQLRVMVEWLPLDSPAYRAQRGHAWQDETVLLSDMSARLRDLLTQIGNLFREKGTQPAKAEYLPSPVAEESFEDGEVLDGAVDAEIRSNMERLWGPV